MGTADGGFPQARAGGPGRAIGESVDTTKLMRCPHCGEEVPSGVYCVRCGALLHPVGEERGSHFAAAPHQHLLVPGVVASLFPRLPSRGHQSFRALLAAGALLIGVLALAGLFPLALIAAAVVVPLIVVLYFHEVDIYEGEPLRAVGLTVAWGALAGVATGLLRNAVQGSGSVLSAHTQTSSVVWNGVALPLIGLALSLAGPLMLLRARKYDDALDGVVFGGGAAVSFAGAYLLTESSAFLSGGLAPTGLVEPWLLRLLTLGIAVPVLAAAAVGATAGSFWLRLRAPRSDRRAHRLLSQPALAVALAALALCAGALLQLYLDRWAALAALMALDVATILWLRQLIQVGLLEERDHEFAAVSTPCPNCGRSAPRLAYCSYCGVSARALPKSGRVHGSAERLRLTARFATALAALVGLALLALALVAPRGFHAPCTTTAGCSTPPQLAGFGAPSPFAAARERTWVSGAGPRLTYDAREWRTLAAGRSRLDLIHANTVELTVRTLGGGAGGTQQALSQQVDALRARYPDLVLDAAHAPATVTLGPLSAIGGLYAGHDALDGAPVEASVEVATTGATTVVATAWTTQQAQSSAAGLSTPFTLLARADAVLETLSWPAAARPKGRL